MAKRKYVKENNLVKAINTDSLELQKPLVNEYYDINVHNSNMDKIDAGYRQNKNDISNINYELSKTENTKYTTENGIKEFSCKDGYVDNVVIEGETLVNLALQNTTNMINDRNRVECENVMGATEFTVINNSNLIIKVDIFKNGVYTRYTEHQPKTVEFVELNEGEVLGLFSFIHTEESNENTLNEFKTGFVILEGDHTDKPISYFEGLKSVGQGDKIEVLTINGSKYDLSGATYATGFFNSAGELDIHDKHKVIEQYLEVEEGKTYVLENIAQATCYYDVNKNLVHYNIDTLICNSPYPQHIQDVHHVFCSVVKIPKGVKYIRVSTGINSVGKINIYKDGKCDHKQISTTLRSLPNGVRDTIEKRGNKYVKVQRCGEITFNGSEVGWGDTISQYNSDTVIGFVIRDAIRTKCLFSDKFSYKIQTSVNNPNFEYITCEPNMVSNWLVIGILRSKLSSQNVEGFKTWLKSNPITVVYELETPIITELPNFNPQTYEGDTTLLLNTGVIQGECEFEVTNSMGSEIEVLKDKVSSLDDTTTTINYRNLRDDITFLNGWGIWGNEARFNCYVADNVVKICILLNPSVLTRYTPIFKLPTQYITQRKEFITCVDNKNRCYMGSLDETCMFTFENDISSESKYIAINFTYPLIKKVI